MDVSGHDAGPLLALLLSRPDEPTATASTTASTGPAATVPTGPTQSQHTHAKRHNQMPPRRLTDESRLGCGGRGLVEQRIVGGIGPCERFEVELARVVMDGMREVEVSGFERDDAVEQSSLLAAMGDQCL